MGASSSSANVPSTGLVETGSIYVLRHPKCKFVTPIRTATGLITVFVVWFAALNCLISITAVPIAIYLMAIGVAVFLLEVGYIIRLCCGVDGVCCRFYGLILNFDGFKRGLLYIFFSIFCFLPSFNNGYTIAAGCFLVVTAALYLAKPLQMKKAPTYTIDPTVRISPNSASAQVADPTVYGS